MRQYPSTTAHDTSELDPCLAAETRMKKSVLSDKMKRLLILLTVLLALVIVLVLLFLVLSNGDDPQRDGGVEEVVLQPVGLEARDLSFNEKDEAKNGPSEDGSSYDVVEYSAEYDDDELTERKDPLFGNKNAPEEIQRSEHKALESHEKPGEMTTRGAPFLRTQPSTTESIERVTSTSTAAPSTTTTTTTATVEATTTTTPPRMVHIPVATTEEVHIPPPTVHRPAQTDLNQIFSSQEPLTDNVERNCEQHLAEDLGSGVYHVSTDGIHRFQVWCDMDTDGGGWTTIQKRVEGRTYFYNRTWAQYEKGFGDVAGSHWLGLAQMHLLSPPTSLLDWTLRIELHGDLCADRKKCSGQPDGFWWGEYDFTLGDAASNYQLNVSPLVRGNISEPGVQGNFEKLNNGQPFTAIDRDNDRKGELNCAQFRNLGGWWHYDCTYMSLNGLYGDTQSKLRYMVYQYSAPARRGMRGLNYYVHPKKSIMMIRPKR